jgi:tetratricopeptide (TPR) repeat protein
MTQLASRHATENRVALFSLLAVLAIGGTVGSLTYDVPHAVQPLRAIPLQPTLPDDPDILHEVQIRFDQGVALLHAKRYEFAETALTRVVELAPRLPEGYVNLGFAILGQQRYEEAGEMFNTAVNLRPEQANAYWGLALALEGLQDYEGALGAMRSYIHLSTVPNDPFLPKARSALWEWEAQLGRIPGAGAAPEGETGSQQMQTPRWSEGHPSPAR